MYFRDCKTLSVFERKIPLTLEFRFHQRVKTMHNAWIFPPISLLNISVYRLQPRLFIDVRHILKKPKRNDEFHYILNCPYFKQYRDIYIKKRYTKRPNIINFLGIMASTNRLNLTNLCKFIRIINERVCPPS
jgi:hypothetical protein